MHLKPISTITTAILQLCTLAIYGDGSQRTFNALSVTVDEAVDRSKICFLWGFVCSLRFY